jgi:hypothetical protein
MNANAAPGDRVFVGPGTYADSISLANAGTGDSDAARIRIEAENSGDKPIFDGASNAVTGSSATAALTSGWSLANGNGIVTYGSGPNSGSGNAACVYRRSYGGAFYGVCLGDPDVDSGIFYNLWAMHQFNHSGNSNYDQPNPDSRMHDTHGHTSGDDFYKDTGRLSHDYRGQCQVSGGNLDIRLDSPAGNANAIPSNRSVWIIARQWGASLINKPYVSLTNIRFRRYKGVNFEGCQGLILNGCEFYQMAWTGVWVQAGSHNARITGCTFRALANSSGHYEDGLRVDSSNDVTIDGCTFAWAGHSAVLITRSARAVVRNSTMRDSHSGLSFDTGNSTGHQVFNNDIYNCGILADMRVHVDPHPGLQLQKCASSRFWRNRVRNCGYCMFQTAGATGVDVANNTFQHNTFAQGEVDTVHMIAYAGGRIYNNTYTNNIFEGPSGGASANRRGLINRQVVNNPGWDGMTFRYNLYNAAAGKSAVIQLGSSPGSFATVKGGGGAAASLPAVFGSSSAEQGVEASPVFVSSTDLHLQAGSPAIGAATAISGESYVGTPDIGAFEYTGGGGNQSPTATITSISNRTPATGQTINLAGSGTDPDGTIAAYEWDFGDGTSSTSQNPTKSYANTGQYTIRFRVRDNSNAWSAYVQDTITVGTGSTAPLISASVGTASASSYQSTDGNYPPGAALDGNDLATSPLIDAGRWVAGSGLSGSSLTLPQWWRRVFPSRYRLEKLETQFQKADQGRVYTFSVQVTENGTAWVDVATNQQSSITNPYYTTTLFTPREVLGYQITLLSNSDNNQFAGLWESKAYGVLIPGGDTSSKLIIPDANWTDTDGKLTTDRFAPWKVNDGKGPRSRDPFSQWSTRLRDGSNNPVNKSLMAHLSAQGPVGRVKIQPYRPTVYRPKFHIEGSTNNGGAWSTILADQVIAGQETTELSWPPQSLTDVRLTFVGETSGPSYVALWDVQFFPG